MDDVGGREGAGGTAGYRSGDWGGGWSDGWEAMWGRGRGLVGRLEMAHTMYFHLMLCSAEASEAKAASLEADLASAHKSREEAEHRERAAREEATAADATAAALRTQLEEAQKEKVRVSSPVYLKMKPGLSHLPARAGRQAEAHYKRRSVNATSSVSRRSCLPNLLVIRPTCPPPSMLTHS